MREVWQPVHLGKAFSDAPRDLQKKLQDEVLRLARKAPEMSRPPQDAVSLYIRVPRGMHAWVRCHITHPDPTASVPMTTGQAIAYAHASRRRCSLSDLSVPDPDIHFLKLDGEHVAELTVTGQVRVRRFSNGLQETATSGPYLSGHGYVDTQVTEPIYLRLAPLPIPVQFVVANVEVEPGYLIGDVPEDQRTEICIGVADLYIDRNFVLRLRETCNLPLSNWDTFLLRQQTGNPLHLPSTVYAVELLYQVAKEQYAPAMIAAGLKLPEPKAVAGAFHARDAKLFSKSVRAPQAARLTRPGGSRNQGLPGQRRDFTDKARHILDTEYALRGLFVSDALALIVHATKYWLRLDAAPRPGNARTLLDELHSYGFRGDDEMEAIFAFITWKNGHFTHPPKDATPPTA